MLFLKFLKTLVLVRWLAVSCFAAFTLSGCGLLPDIKAPKVSVSDIQLKKIGPENRIVISLQVTNPNDVDFDIQSIRCGLELNVNDEAFVQGAATSAFTLEPNSFVEVPLIIPSLTADVVSDLARILWICITEGKPASYRLIGTQTINLPLFGAREISLSSTGTLQLSIQDKAIHYALKGPLTVKHPLGAKKWPLSITGEIPLVKTISNSVKE